MEVEQKDPFEKHEAALSYFSWILQLHSERIRRTIEVQGSQEKRAVGSEVSTVGCFTEAGKMPNWSTAAQLLVNVRNLEGKQGPETNYKGAISSIQACFLIRGVLFVTAFF